MSKPVAIPNTFATATTVIPLSNLDGNFTAVATSINSALTYSNYAADTGAANAYVVTFTGLTTTYTAGLRIQFKAANANTGASTINVNAQGTKSITFQNAAALTAGIIAANSIVDVMYDGTQFLLMNDPAGLTGGDVVGPASATDNAVVRFDGTTGKLVQNSVVTIADTTGDVAGVGALTASGNVTLSGGTANGVLYLDGSKVATSGSAVTYNGTTFSTSADASINGLTVGRGAGAVSTNTAVGASALAANTTGARNSGIGAFTLSTHTTATDNTGVGYGALNATTGSFNTAVGGNAFDNNSTGTYNTGLGYYAGKGNTTGAYNTAVGAQALNSNTTASNNTAVGYQAGYSNTTGTGLTALGYQAGYSSTASSNTFLGWSSGYYNTTGVNNVAVGYGAYAQGGTSATGNYNIAIGPSSLHGIQTGSNNTAVGYQAGYSLNTASNNTAVGYQAGDVITTGARNTIIGDGSDPSANNGNDQTVVGQGLTGKGDDTAFIGGTNGAYNEKNVTTWETTSDERIKKNIVDNTVGLEKIKQIRIRNFEYRKPEEITELPDHAAINKDGVQLGVIAQEIQQVLPECVTENSTGVLSVSTDPLVWHLINAVKQLSAEVESLKSQLKGN